MLMVKRITRKFSKILQQSAKEKCLIADPGHKMSFGSAWWGKIKAQENQYEIIKIDVVKIDGLSISGSSRSLDIV